MRLLKIFLLIPVAVFILAKEGFAYIDPFVDPLKVREIAEIKRKVLEARKKRGVKVKIVRKPHLFKLSIPPMENLTFQGVIGDVQNLKVVAVDSSTGKVYILSPGDSVDVNARIVKVQPQKLIIKVYEKQGEKLVSKLVTVNFNTGEGK